MIMTIIVSQEVSRRRKEKEELKQVQKYEMGLYQVNHSHIFRKNSHEHLMTNKFCSHGGFFLEFESFSFLSTLLST